MQRIYILIFLCFFCAHTSAQEKYKYNGIVVDAESNERLPYATLTIKELNSNKIIGGAESNENGEIFIELSTNRFRLQFDYIGYERKVIVQQSMEESINLGFIELVPKDNQLSGVDLIGRKSDVEIRLDKRVYNIGETIDSRGKDISEVLENIPTVSIDVDGNLELRGSSNVRILIDGKPSALVNDGIDILADLPAETIDKVEVITSPSARYQAEGSSGIINIVLAKKGLLGLNGIFNFSAKKNNSFSGNSILNYKNGKFNFFTTSSLRDETDLGMAYQDNVYKNNNIIDRFVESRDFSENRKGNNINFGVDYNLSKMSKLTISYFLNDRNGLDLTPLKQFQYKENLLISESIRNLVKNDLNFDKQFNLSFIHKFNEGGHKIDFTFQNEIDDESEKSDLRTELIYPNYLRGLLEENNVEEDEEQLLFQLDYVNPIDENTQIEAGFRHSSESKITKYDVLFEQENGILLLDENLSNSLDYSRGINALYFQYGKKLKMFSFLLGLRYEQTITKIFQQTTNEKAETNTGNFFPTLNLGFEINQSENITLGYSRRLSRPNSWNLNPFRERTSETSYYTGNPFLKPSYSDNFDFGYIKQFNIVTISGSLYLNQNYGAFDRVTIETGEYTSVNGLSTPIVRRSPINLSKEERFGFELNNSFKWNTNWKSNISLNYYKQFKRGTYDEISYDSENKSWSGNFRNSLLFPGKINTQLNVRFRGPRKSAYSEVKSSISADFTMNKDFLNDRATVSFSFSDLFNSREYRYKTFTENITTNAIWRRNKPTFEITLTYRLKQDKRKKQSASQFNFDGNYDM